MNNSITLKRELRSWHIFMIAVGSTIGIGWSKSGSEILAIAGPAGTLTAFGIVGGIACCVMEGICEMIVLWPISNAMVEFVKAFVDKDLGFVVGLTYWYTYCTTLAALIIGATGALDYWYISRRVSEQRLVYAGSVAVVILVNFLGVKWFGIIETIGGVLKVTVLFLVFVGMMCINYGVGGGPVIKNRIFSAGSGFDYNPNVASNQFRALCIAIPIATFAFIGVEMVTVMAFEARNTRELRFPSKHIAYCISAIYLIVIGGYVANVEWFNQNLPKLFNQPLVSLESRDFSSVPIDFPGDASRSNHAAVIAMLQASIATVPGVISGFIFYSGISCATANLYVASRSLYGLTRHMIQDDPEHSVKSLFAKLNTVSTGTRVPFWALGVSDIPATILPFVVQESTVSAEIQQILVHIGSVGCVLVWASQCLAYIYYYKWLKKHKAHLVGPYAKYNRWPKTENAQGEVVFEDRKKRFTSWLAIAQPIPAYVGFVLCLVIVFILNSVSTWNGVDLRQKLLTIYLGPLLQGVLFIILKFMNGMEWRQWFKLGPWDGPGGLRNTLNRLSALENRPMLNATEAAEAGPEEDQVVIEEPDLTPPTTAHQTNAITTTNPTTNPYERGFLRVDHNKITPSSSASRSIEPEPETDSGVHEVQIGDSRNDGNQSQNGQAIEMDDLRWPINQAQGGQQVAINELGNQTQSGQGNDIEVQKTRDRVHMIPRRGVRSA